MPSLDNAPVFLGAGQRDPIAPPAETERLTALLRQAGASVTTQYQPAGHGITPDDVNAAREWLSGRLSS